MIEEDEQTVALDDSYREIVRFANRDFQRYALENGVYFAPVDDDEIDRLQYMHAIFNMMFDNRLIFPPIPNPQRILDCGYGSAAWAIDVARQYPECEVLGIDIYPYPIPEDCPPNVDFQVDDLNSPSTFPSNYFDLVHSRMMAGGIHANQWPNYMRDIYRILRPGGWCQMVEIYFNAQSDNGTLTAGMRLKGPWVILEFSIVANVTRDHALRRWSQLYLNSMQPAKDPRAAMHLQNWMIEAGFEQVEARMLTLPLSGWPTDPRQHDIGAANRPNVHRLLLSLALYPFSRVLGLSNTDIQLLVAQARNEADNPAFKV
ncbi:uncharacterized protein CTHT_0029470 [Thermochaetoides thermophila DSM 1495]|uniref:S-adenosyl-L-methionine-dependent methyltransferase n=1 Tax=Chaetomium thermophilum (strain DSM 1495 / CBS 144.50 / IMI 039719) TaxID=759272 RepID=G0S859_CHATD|nr:hypothetical protein CTHT_0029470 [Thermochaetoides thermophila DSM 1495]EGS21106.1 hypothetical protein CTHT_0029470 [Thermochaetoides thermophila DSM 1495]